MRTRFKYQFAVWLAFIGIFFIGCRKPTLGPIGTKAFSVLADFVLVGTAPYHPNDSLDHSVPAHGSGALSIPTELQVNKFYIFHHRRPLDGQRLALSELPLLMREHGMEIVQGPKSSRDLIFPYVGEPVFTIKFKDGAHVGFIFSQLCPNLREEIDAGWTGNDYVLLYTQ
jgi:hypothetical protein